MWIWQHEKRIDDNKIILNWVRKFIKNKPEKESGKGTNSSKNLDLTSSWHLILPSFSCYLQINKFVQWGSVTHQMAVLVPSISCCVLNHHNLFYQIQNAQPFNRDTCCHLVLCLWLLPFNWTVHKLVGIVKITFCLETSGGQKSNSYLKVVHFFNTIVN